MLIALYRICLFFCLISATLHADFSLRDNLQRAKPGDFIVASQNKNYTLLHIYAKKNDVLTIEEITVPTARMGNHKFPSWREWVKENAPYNTSWLLYTVTLSNGQMQHCYSVSKKEWVQLSKSESFLPTLMNLRLTPMPTNERRKVGPPPSGGMTDLRPYWQPNMVVDGKTIKGVAFTPWRTHWPQDASELSGKTIDIFLPENNDLYSNYFPYWLQVKGSVGKATVYIIDSGSGLVSPAPPIPNNPL